MCMGDSPLGAPAHVHPDQHGIAFMVASGKAPGYFAHDGGISRTLDGYAGLNTGSCTGTNQFDSLSAEPGIDDGIRFGLGAPHQRGHSARWNAG